jgi:UDP-3-O-[3-hydroxymyristoyl] glucosamine N-acyltransferase
VTFQLQELAALSGGELLGDPALTIRGAASLAEAMPGEISFFGDARYLAALRKTQASAVFVPRDFSEPIKAAQIRVDNPNKAFEQVLFKLAPAPIAFAPGIHPTAIIDSTARLGTGVSIQPYAIIEAGVTIGDGTRIGAGSYIGHESAIGAQTIIYPNVSIRERAQIGARVIIHSGAVIGADGFGFEKSGDSYAKVPQIGIVQIDDDVEIGANTTIDRARFGRTWIQRGVKLDNHVQIAHNVVIGQDTAIAAHVGIAGSVRIGKNVLIGGQAGITGHVEVGDNTIICAKSGISKSISGGMWFLSPAVPLDKAKEQIARIHRLAKLYPRVEAIEKKLGL